MTTAMMSTSPASTDLSEGVVAAPGGFSANLDYVVHFEV